METKTDFSYGVIPIRCVAGRWEVFLIHQYSRIGNNAYWILPKGHANAGETPEQTATRELQEETGLRAKKILTEPMFTLGYTFMFEGAHIQKTVQFFIGIIAADAVPVLDAVEVREAGWYALKDAADRLEYQGTKKMFTEVKMFIEHDASLLALCI